MGRLIITLVLLFFVSVTLKAQLPESISNEYSLSWEDNFEYSNSKLEKNWESQNGPSGHILCSRWRENAVVENGILELQAKKEQRGGQEWTAGNIWTKKKFKYGYFECRYKYAAANATNNSFWLMTRGGEPTEGKKFEIDINEGHFPNEVNTNIHNWSDFTYNANGKKKHWSNHKGFSFGTKPDYSFQLEIPVKTTKVRLVSKNKSKFHIREFRVFGVNNDGNYPIVLSETADKDVKGLVNYVRNKNVKISSSGIFKNQYSENNLADGKINTSWVTQVDGEKWIEFEWQKEIEIGCIQFINGWNHNGNWNDLLSEFKVQYFNNGNWQDIAVLDIEKSTNFAEEFHTYGLEWNENELVFYFDGKEIRREKNTFCYSEAPIWLSLAIIKWSGAVTDAIDGTSMKIDYVKYYQPKSNY
ncbi:family 16 glycosylhydrolase [Lutibacter sp. TH_r2]|uniref:family 16 glycosylhydrolase n=1 Tax=Lutibacter sp. TH_r2 TaxID=3082083 RepID=UPI00295433F4|nr:family 16 glycosylhydrolase [Lutibacter sp. TH_r2]MDV7185890.1 family 16 glycosylhydrolase [Lutibacter sp. TH_r2]